ncbi:MULTISPECIES: aldehyde dehydrogenase family protein [unclassified Paenibacillus]|uniref:aldehyde dehydrogenase family protein n=1 Tax=unclassified Paenibacillus TaxID=185978 RepID=UPI00362FE665
MSIPVYGSIIGNETDTSGETIAVFNKYSGERIAEIHKAGHEVVSRAVENALHTYRTVKLSPVERCNILLKAAQLLKERKEELALSLVREVGRTLKDCRIEIDRAVATFTISAEEAKRITGHCVPISGQQGNENRLSFTIRVPVGVVCAITPFNNPLNLTAHKIAPAIAAGNTIVLKPAELTPVTVMAMVAILQEAGLPPGFLNVVNGLGQETGQYLLEDERIHMFTFTGSVGVGRHIKSTTGIRKVTLELGSNSPTIVHHDAVQIGEIAELCALRGFSTANGQACISVQRLYVHQEIHDQFVSLLLQAAGRLRIGNPEEPDTDIGPLISEKEALRIEAWVNEAAAAGAKVLCGGKRDGSFYEPTVISGVNPEMKVMCQELFGPVINIIPYEDIDWVFSQANDSKFGLQAGLFTSNLQLAMRAVHELEFGGVLINDVSTFRSDVMPYGGIKNSGIGKEGPRYTIEEMTDERIVVIKM